MLGSRAGGPVLRNCVSTSYSCRGGKGVVRQKGPISEVGSAHPLVLAPASVPLAVASFYKNKAGPL